MRVGSNLLMSITLALGVGLGSSALAESGIGGEVVITSDIPAKEQLKFGSEALVEMGDAKRRAEKLLDLAEKTGDADIIQCVRLRLASITTLREVSEGVQTRMSENIASSNKTGADFEFRKIAVSLSKVRQFIAEAEACLGESGSADDVTRLDVDNGGVADGDDTEPLTGDLGTIGVDPPGISPLE